MLLLVVAGGRSVVVVAVAAVAKSDIDRETFSLELLRQGTNCDYYSAVVLVQTAFAAAAV